MGEETGKETKGRTGAEPVRAAEERNGQTVGEALEAAVKGPEAAADPTAKAALPPAEHLLAGYDRMRVRILAAVEERGGWLGADLVRVLLLVPDVFLLLVRLILDKEVPAGARATLAAALAYFLLPIDLLPEAIIGGAGYLDDVVLATALVAQAFGGELEPYAKKHWSGPEELREVMRDVSAAAHRLFDEKLHGRLHKLLGKVDSRGGEEDEEG